MYNEFKVICDVLFNLFEMKICCILNEHFLNCNYKILFFKHAIYKYIIQ